jgi:hypothetical protein
MIWKRFKKVIIPLIIAKFIIFGFLIFRGDFINISREINYSSFYQEGYDNDSIVIAKQKFIRIVRNEDTRGISIKLRGKKNATPQMEKEGEIRTPVAD